jgi:hypothetical protein
MGIAHEGYRYSLNVSISSTIFKGHRYPLPPIGVGSIYMHIFMCNVFLTTQYTVCSPSPPKAVMGVIYMFVH